MATLNLGRIKPVFQGAYNNSTAYVVDDIVTFGNETFICILASTGNATSNATYWTKLAAKGTDGTDVGTTLTTQGDILYRDGSGLQRLAKGTAGQELRINSGATAPEWYTPTVATSDFVKLGTQDITSAVSSINFQGIFTSDYDVYKVYAQGIQNSTASYERFGLLVGTTLQTANYHNFGRGLYSNTSDTSNNTHDVGQVDSNGFRTMNTWNNNAITGNKSRSHEVTIFNPRCIDNLQPHFHSMAYQYDDASYRVGYVSWGRYTSYSTSIDGLQVNALSGNMTNGRISVYGIKH